MVGLGHLPADETFLGKVMEDDLDGDADRGRGTLDRIRAIGPTCWVCV